MMWRRGMILVAGLFLAIGAYGALYFSGTARHRQMIHEPASELLWLRSEFKLNDLEFKRISDLHDAYLPRCREMCRRIAAKNVELKTIIAQTNTVTPAIREKLAEIAAVRSECQATMLRHFFDVSQAMPADQGRRYLEWIENKTLRFAHGDARDLGHEMQ
jgi:hypothetical protein